MKAIFNFATYVLFILFTFSYKFSYNFNYFGNNCENTDAVFNVTIPSINVRKEIYSFDSKNNNVNKGIYLAKPYNLRSPDGALILASHSGNSNISHFRDLHKLGTGAIFILEDQTYKYLYMVTDFYKIEKNGYFKFLNDRDLAYLITCDKNNDDKQIVYVGKRINIIKKLRFYEKNVYF